MHRSSPFSPLRVGRERCGFPRPPRYAVFSCRGFRPHERAECPAVPLTDCRSPDVNAREWPGDGWSSVRRMRIRADHTHTGRCFDAELHLSAPNGNHFHDDIITDLDCFRWFSSQYKHGQAVVQSCLWMPFTGGSPETPCRSGPLPPGEAIRANPRRWR